MPSPAVAQKLWKNRVIRSPGLRENGITAEKRGLSDDAGERRFHEGSSSRTYKGMKKHRLVGPRKDRGFIGTKFFYV